MKPKTNRKADASVSLPMDCCYTPSYALDPLRPFLKRSWRIWEPAAGRGHLIRELRRTGFSVVGTELAHLDPTDRVCGDEIGYGLDFFSSVAQTFSAIVTNPPYSIKPAWIRRCYELGRPFALLVPVETIGTGDVQRMMEQHGAELLLLNKRVNFYMPSGKDGSAQFPVLWFCWNVLPAPLVYGRITRRQDEQMQLLEVAS